MGHNNLLGFQNFNWCLGHAAWPPLSSYGPHRPSKPPEARPSGGPQEAHAGSRGSLPVGGQSSLGPGSARCHKLLGWEGRPSPFTLCGEPPGICTLSLCHDLFQGLWVRSLSPSPGTLHPRDRVDLPPSGPPGPQSPARPSLRGHCSHSSRWRPRLPTRAGAHCHTEAGLLAANHGPNHDPPEQGGGTTVLEVARGSGGGRRHQGEGPAHR